MAIRVRKVKDKKTTAGFSYVALCAAETKAEHGDIYLDDSVHHALSNKFRSDFEMENRHENERETIIPCPVINLNVEAIDVKKARKLLKEELGPELVELLKSNNPVDVKKAKESMIKVMKTLKFELGGLASGGLHPHCPACGRRKV